MLHKKISFTELLKNTRRDIHVIASGLSNHMDRKHVKAYSIFVFVADQVFAESEKMISLNSDMIFDTNKTGALLEKNISDITNNMILSSMMIATIVMTMEVMQKLSIDVSMQTVAEKAIQLSNQIGISFEVSQTLKKWITAKTDFAFTDSIEASIGKQVPIELRFLLSDNSIYAVMEKFSDDNDAKFQMKNDEIYIELTKTVDDNTAGFIFGSYANAIVSEVVERLRKLIDIDTKTLSNIDSFKMSQFDWLR